MDIAVIIAISIILCVVCFIVGQKTVKHQEQLNNDEVLRQRVLIEQDINSKASKLNDLEKQHEKQMQLISDTEHLANKTQEERLRSLDMEYRHKREQLETEYRDYIDKRAQEIDEYFLQKEQDIEILKQEFQKLKDTRMAAIEAARKEKEVEDQPQKYCIPMDDAEIHDIEYLNNIMPKLNYPEVLGKCIWSVFFQKKMKNFLTNLLGQEDVCGIYKITDILTKEAYIGQSKTIMKRWTDHVKCGVGAMPASNANQLYAAMRRDGAWNFSFELLEKCAPEELDDKERYFIDLYSSDIVGLNSKRGNQSTLSKENT